MNTQELNQSKSEIFAEKMLGILNGGALGLMISIGHRTGLFDTMAELPPATSPRIAEEAGLNERYVREWLGALVTGRVIEYDPADGTYRLPPEHAAFLTRAASSNNFATTAQFLSVLGGVEDQIIGCFKNGGGVPYSAFPRFHEVMAEQSSQTVVSALVDSILPLAPGLVERLRNGIEVLDVGCGSGRALRLMAEVFPRSRFAGFDFSEEAVAAASAEVRRRRLSNIHFEVKDVATLNGSRSYDFVTAFDAIHDQAKPAVVLKGVARALSPDGVFLMQDIAGSSHLHKNFDHPVAPFLYATSCLHCMTVSLEQGGEGLGTMWGEEKARQMLAEAGFANVEAKRLPHDIINTFYVARKG